MGARYAIHCKMEFENTWPDILTEKLLGLAKVERVEESTYCIRYDSKSLELNNILIDPQYYRPICVTHDNGFFWIAGRKSNLGRWVIIIIHSESIDSGKHKIIRKKIIEILEELNDENYAHNPAPPG